MEEIPLQIAPTADVWAFVLPSDGVLGSSENDYEHVQIQRYDVNQTLVEEGKADFFSSGKLGALEGGLRNLDDVRQSLSKEAICEIQNELGEHQIAAARPGLIEKRLP